MEIELRLILLVVGLIILVVVGFDHLKRKKSKNKTLDSNRLADTRPVALPVLDETNELGLIPDIYQTQADSVLPEEIEYKIETEEILDDVSLEIPSNVITISIMSRDPYGFLGADLLDVLEGANLVYGKNEVFHRVDDDKVLFNVVNAIEPGYFILETLADEHIPGITLILLPEEVSNPQQAFDKLIRTAKQIAFALNGELVDHQRQPLTLTTIEHYRQQLELVAV